MEMTKSEFFKWANGQTQWTENEMLSPHNRDIADSEEVEVLAWSKFTSIANRLIDGAIVIKKGGLTCKYITLKHKRIIMR